MKYFSPTLLDGSVTTAKLANNAVTLPKVANSAIRKNELGTTPVSMAGALGAISVLDIALTPYAFWPMLHVSDATDIRVSGHEVDGGSADAPRLALYNSSGSGRSYDLDYRYVQ